MNTTENNGERAFSDWVVSRGFLPQRLVPNGSPRCDFLVDIDGQSVVFEVYTFFGSTNESPGGRLISDINLRLAKTALSGVVSVRVDTDRVISIAGRSRIAGASKEISNWIVASIKGRGEEREQNEILIPNAGSYSYRPLAGRERLYVIGPSQVQMCRSKDLLREALEKKGTQYKKSTERGLPYVTVLFSEYPGTDIEDVGQALYGDMKVTWSIPEGKPSIVWTDAGTGFFQESKNRDVCGLLVALWTIRDTFSVGEFGFFENPWTRYHAWVPSITRLAPHNMVGYGNEAPSEFGALTKLLNPSG